MLVWVKEPTDWTESLQRHVDWCLGRVGQLANGQIALFDDLKGGLSEPLGNPLRCGLLVVAEALDHA